MVKFINEANENKVHNIKEKLDKFYTLIISALWVISTIFDLICFHCFWSDYMLELYSCFFLIFMSLYSLIPAKIPKFITNYFGLISIILGRAIVMIIFSLLFLGDKHLFHKLCAIFLFIGGFILLVMEILAPEDLDNKFLPSNENNISTGNDENSHDSNPPTKLDEENQQGPENLDGGMSNPSDMNITS